MLSLLGLIGCSLPQAGTDEPRGVTREHWEWLKQKCDVNMERRSAGYMDKFDRNYCAEMEEMRERMIHGDPWERKKDHGAMNF